MGNIAGYFTSIPIDWFVLCGLLILIGLDVLRSGVGRACALAVALPITLFLSSHLHSAIVLSSVTSLIPSVYAEAVIFAAIALISYFLVRRMGLEFLDGGIGQPIQALFAGAAVTVIFAIVWLQTPALHSLPQLGPQVQALFAENFRLFWLLGAYGALAFARG